MRPPLDTVILAGSILNEDLDLNRLTGNVARIINEVAPNDPIVKFAKPASLWSDPLLGRSGDVGFTQSSSLLQQQVCQVFDHNNAILRDVVSRRWPWLEAHVGRGEVEAEKLLIARHAADQKMDFTSRP
jgi:hypothetical protein